MWIAKYNGMSIFSGWSLYVLALHHPTMRVPPGKSNKIISIHSTTSSHCLEFVECCLLDFQPLLYQRLQLRLGRHLANARLDTLATDRHGAGPAVTPTKGFGKEIQRISDTEMNNLYG
jgi:hypothetical protein